MRLTSSTAELRPKHLRECHVRQQHSVPLQLQTVALGLLGVQRQWHSVTLYLAALGLEGGVSGRRRLIPSADEAQRGRSRAHAEWSLRSVDTNPNPTVELIVVISLLVKPNGARQPPDHGDAWRATVELIVVISLQAWLGLTGLTGRAGPVPRKEMRSGPTM
jgi:hypothetical protein